MLPLCAPAALIFDSGRDRQNAARRPPTASPPTVASSAQNRLSRTRLCATPCQRGSPPAHHATIFRPPAIFVTVAHSPAGPHLAVSSVTPWIRRRWLGRLIGAIPRPNFVGAHSQHLRQRSRHRLRAAQGPLTKSASYRRRLSRRRYTSVAAACKYPPKISS